MAFKKTKETNEFFANIKKERLYSSTRDKEIIYKEVSPEQENNAEFVKSKFKFIKQEPAMIGILKTISEKHGISLYDSAYFVFAGCCAIQDNLDGLAGPRLKGHFTSWFLELPFLNNDLVCNKLECYVSLIDDAIRRECAKDYFKYLKEINKAGRILLMKFHDSNRMKKMGYSKKIKYRIS